MSAKERDTIGLKWDEMTPQEKVKCEAEGPCFRIEHNGVNDVLRISLPIGSLADDKSTGMPLMIGLMDLITKQAITKLGIMQAQKRPGANLNLIDPRKSGLPPQVH